MAAIAYLSDQNMLDYHRINGSQEIVFWRVSTKKFSSFDVGDLLFFLAKGSENTRNNEKGITGYGCFAGERQMSVDSMWKKYGEATGYINKEELKNAILKTTKKERLPDKISCLILKDVIFFLGPIYLSELGIKIPANLESFTYLDANEGHITLELLEKVKEIGLDYWSAALSNRIIDTERFNREIMKYQIASIYESGNISSIGNGTAFRKHAFSSLKHTNPEWINKNQDSFIVYGDPNSLYYLFTSSQRENKDNFIRLLGQLNYISYCLKEKIEENIEITVISNYQFSREQENILRKQGINIQY